MSGGRQRAASIPVAELVDPVAPLGAWSAVGTVARHDVLQNPAASFNGLGRRHVVVITGHQDPINAERASDDERLAQDLGGVTVTTIGRADRLADVTTDTIQPVVEFRA